MKLGSQTGRGGFSKALKEQRYKYMLVWVASLAVMQNLYLSDKEQLWIAQLHEEKEAPLLQPQAAKPAMARAL
ncbi:hypothetical protein EJB05_15721, partial [Eragrostis curvula]